MNLLKTPHDRTAMKLIRHDVTNTPGLRNESISEHLLHRYVQRFRGGLVFEAHRLCVSLDSRLESNKEEEEGEQIC